jgi:GNAT superfamily N-acetyltransferase
VPAAASIEPVDPATAPVGLLDEMAGLLCALDLEESPDGPPMPPAEARDLLALTGPRSTHRWWVARDEGSVTGLAWIELTYREDNRHLCEGQVVVRSDARRRGIGSALLEASLAAARADGRTAYVTWTSSAEGAAFAARHGMAHGQDDRAQRLRPAEVPPELLERWRAGGRDFELLSWTGPCPAEHLEGFAAVRAAMNDAPRDAPSQEALVATPQRQRDWEHEIDAIGYTHLVCAGRVPGSREIAGFTEVLVSRHRPRFAYQADTGVIAAHRGRGLARRLKAEMLLRLPAEAPELEVLETYNAAVNPAMLAINAELGFRLHRVLVSYERSPL